MKHYDQSYKKPSTLWLNSQWWQGSTHTLFPFWITCKNHGTCKMRPFHKEPDLRGQSDYSGAQQPGRKHSWVYTNGVHQRWSRRCILYAGDNFGNLVTGAYSFVFFCLLINYESQSYSFFNDLQMNNICFSGDDHQALIWDIQQMPRAIEDPILAYTADGEINQIQWASTQPDWIGICYNNNLEILRV